MAVKDFENYLTQIQRTGQAQQGLSNINQIGQIVGNVQQFQQNKNNQIKSQYDMLLNSGFEPEINGGSIDDKVFKRMMAGEDVPGLSWKKTPKSITSQQDEMVIPTPTEIEAAKVHGINLPADVPQRRSSINKWITPKAVSAQTTGVSLEDATPGQIATARALIRGDILTENLGTRDRGITTQLAVQLSEKEGIPFQSYQGNTRKGMAANLASGKMGFNALSLNTGIGHAGDAMEAFNKIQNTDIKMLNTPLNILKKNTNDPNIIELELNLNALSGELATIFKGSAGTDQEIKHWMDVLSPNLTPLQAKMAMQKIAELLTSRLNAIEYQQQDVMSNPVGERKLISPKSEKTMKALSGETAGITTTDDPMGLFK